MKKSISYIAILAMLLTLFAAPAYAAPPSKPDPTLRVYDECQPGGPDAINFAAELIAGQDIDVGEVRIDATNVPNRFRVTYIIDEPDWYLTEIHFEAISDTDEDFIFSKGGLIPGSFTCKESWDISEGLTTYTFLYTAGAPVTGFAAHAVVCQSAVTEIVPHSYTLLSDANTLFESAPDTWTSAAAAWVHPAWENYPDTNALLDDGALWIWESYRVNNPVLGDIVEFKSDFNIVGVPAAATLTITADNAYAFRVNNGTETESDSLFGDWRNSNLTDDFVSPVVGTWTDTEVYNVLADILSGDNTLYVTGVNEYQGTLDGALNGTIDSNPGAVIFKLMVCSEETVTVCPEVCETAWGEGDPVNAEDEGGNWSMIIPREQVPAGYKLIESLDVQSENGDGVTTTAILGNGKQYELRASGTFDYSSDIYDEADAEWFEKSGGWIKGETGVYADKTNVIDVSVNGDPTNDDWGSYNPAHEYAMDYTGTGSTLHLFIFDTNYTDNSGSIHVDIYEVLW